MIMYVEPDLPGLEGEPTAPFLGPFIFMVILLVAVLVIVIIVLLWKSGRKVIIKEIQKPNHCSSCGMKIEGSTPFCPFCGEKL